MAGTFYTAVRMFRLNGCKASIGINVSRQAAIGGIIVFQCCPNCLAKESPDIDVTAQDRFSGTVEHKSHLRRPKEPEVIGLQIEDTHYKYQFDLADLSADSIESIRSVPNQLNANTYFRCSEDPSCLLSWISLRSTGAK